MSYSNYQGFAQSEQEKRDLADSLEEASKVMLGDPPDSGPGPPDRGSRVRGQGPMRCSILIVHQCPLVSVS